MGWTIERGYRAGCIGRVTQIHADFYSRHCGFDMTFEADVARELSDLCVAYDADRDGLWLAIHNGSVEGSVAIDGSEAQAEGARLRWFITSEAIRGQGVGAELLAAALRFCDERYARTYLWTFDELPAALHLYAKAGFRLEHTERAVHWGREINAQRFTRDRPDKGV